LGQGAAERSDGGRRTGVVDAAGKQEMNRLGDDSAFESFEDNGLRLLPEDEAGPRPDVATALSALEDESPRAVLEKPTEKSRRWYVQIGGNPLRFEHTCLVGTASRDQGKRGTRAADFLDLFVAKLRWYKAQDANAPGTAGQLLGSAAEQSPDVRPAHQCQRQE